MKKIIVILCIFSNLSFSQENVELKTSLFLKKPCSSQDTKGVILEIGLKNLNQNNVYFELPLNHSISLFKITKKGRIKVNMDLYEKYRNIKRNNSICWQPYFYYTDINNNDSLNKLIINELIKLEKIKLEDYSCFENPFLFIPFNKTGRYYMFFSGKIYDQILKNNEKFEIEIELNSKKNNIKFPCKSSVLFPNRDKKDTLFINHPKLTDFEYINCKTKKVILKLDAKHLPSAKKNSKTLKLN